MNSNKSLVKEKFSYYRGNLTVATLCSV